LEIARGIEVGHIFQLGQLYSQAMKATRARRAGQGAHDVHGLLRHRRHARRRRGHRAEHDANGIIWPDALAPFHVILVPINYQKSPKVMEATDALYQEFIAAGIEVLLDDRDARPGVKFADANSSAYRIESSSASAAWPRVISSIGIAAPPNRQKSPPADPVAFIRQKLSG
jgi:prolyl-tRNA synthetase